MKGSKIIKQKKVVPEIVVKPFPGILPAGVLFPEKLKLANTILKSVRSPVSSTNKEI